jgi:acyl dehydratase
VHVQSTARKNVGARDEAIVLTWQRKVQVYKRDENAELHPGDVSPDPVACELVLPPYDRARDYKSLAHLSSPDSYFEDFEPDTRIEHSRGRTMTSEHIHLTAVLDNTSQVHCNQFMIDQDPAQYVGGQLIIFGGIPFVLCLGLSSPDVGDNALGDIVYPTGRHTAPLFAGDTVFAATEITGKRDYPGRPDLGVLETRLLGHKFERAENAKSDDAPPGWKKTRIFELERQIAVKRRSHYT